MNLSTLISHYHTLSLRSDQARHRKTLSRIVALLRELEQRGLTEEPKIAAGIERHLGSLPEGREARAGLKALRKYLREELAYVPPNYYLTLGLGIGLAMGSSLGISFGVPFENGIVFGPMLGSTIGIVGGLLVGQFLDWNKQAENRILQNL